MWKYALSWQSPLNVALFNAIMVWIVYANSLGNPFVFDDTFAIVEEPSLQWNNGFSDLFAVRKESPLSGRPLVTLSFVINYAFTAHSVWHYRLTNVVLHWLNSVVLFFVFQQWLKRLDLFQGDRRRLFICAASISIVWLLHPLHTEVINYISQRTEIMVSFFYLLALLLLTNSEGKLSLRVLLGIACAWLGVLCKESIATLPLGVLLADWTFSSQEWSSPMRKRQWVYVALFAIWIPLCGIVAMGLRSGTVGFDLGMSPFAYLITQCWVIPRYLLQAILPINLLIDYGVDPADFSLFTASGFLFLLSLFVFSTYFIAKRSVIGLMGGLFFLLLAPTSSVIPIVTEVGAERRMYLALVPVIVLAVCGMTYLLSTFQAKRSVSLPTPSAFSVMMILAAVLLVAEINLTSRRNLFFANPITLWTDAARKHPSNARAFVNLSAEFTRNRQFNEALDASHTALQLSPNNVPAKLSLAISLMNTRSFDESLAILRSLETVNSRTQPVYGYMAKCFLAMGDRRNARVHLERALRVDPNSAVLLLNLGILEFQEGRVDLAIKYLRESEKRGGGFDAMERLGLVAYSARRIDIAISAFERALQYKPKDLDCRFNLCMSYVASGRRDLATQAEQQFESMFPESESITELRKTIQSMP